MGLRHAHGLRAYGWREGRKGATPHVVMCMEQPPWGVSGDARGLVASSTR